VELQNSSEESSAAQILETAQKRRMDLMGRRSNTSVVISPGSAAARAPDGATTFLPSLLLADTNTSDPPPSRQAI
jgi:hypothetical protein